MRGRCRSSRARSRGGTRALEGALQDTLRRAGFSPRETQELHHQLANLLLALVAPELHGRTNRAAFQRGLDMLHAGLKARLKQRR